MAAANKTPKTQLITAIVPLVTPSEGLLDRWKNAPQLAVRIERFVQSALEQDSESGFEVLVVDDGSRDRLVDQLRRIFPDAEAENRLNFARVRFTGDHGKNINEASKLAQGKFLCLCDPVVPWKPRLIKRIERELKNTDLILFTDDTLERTDWLRAFLLGNPASRGFGLLRRELFEKIKGLPTGYGGIPLPRKIPGDWEYETWLRAIIALDRKDSLDRMTILRNDYLEKAPNSPAIATKRRVRQGLTLARVLRKVPRAYWATLLGRFKEPGLLVLKQTEQLLKRKKT